MLRPQTFQCQSQLHACTWKICHPSIVVLLYLLSLNSWWFDGFLSHFKGFFIWSRWYRQFCLCWARKNLHHIDTVRPTIKAEREKLYSKADLSKQKWNSLVSAVSTHTLGPVHSRRGDGVLAVKVSLLAYDMLLCLVWQWQWAFTALLGCTRGSLV